MPENNQPEPLVSIEDMAAALSISTRTVRRMVDSGEIAAYRVGPKLLRFNLTKTLEALRLEAG